MKESPAATRCCPSCKMKATTRDIRPLYAKKICVVDKSDEYRLQSMLDSEKLQVAKLRQDVALLRLELDVQQRFTDTLKEQLQQSRKQALGLSESVGLSATNACTSSICSSSSASAAAASTTNTSLPRLTKMFRLSRDRTINICQEPGCRVMVHSRANNKLIVSQKSTQSLFPGYGVRFIDLPSYRPSQFLHMATKQLRDLAFDGDGEHLLAAASMDACVKLYDISTMGSRQSSSVIQFCPSDSGVWSVAFDKCRTKSMYLGTQNGTTYTYDIRSPANYLYAQKTAGDMSPVINICPVAAHQPHVPYGGFLVCKLQSVWFYEYTADERLVGTRFTVVGPFVSMSWDERTQHIVLATRPTAAQPSCRYVVANLRRIDETIVLQVVATMYGSTVQAVMTRCAQISVDNGSTMIVAAYMQDSKQLHTMGVDLAKRESVRMQQLPIDDCMLDLCPIYLTPENVCLAGLSDTKCRIFQINGDGGATSSAR